jgi:hypothetical protein
LDARWLLLGLWLCCFVIRGLLYLALMPPWQAPDEPTSVELTLTMLDRGRLVSPADASPTIQRAIIASMERTNFWAYGIGHEPSSPDAGFNDIWPNRSQLHRPPLYALLLLPIARLTSDWPLEQQLYLFHVVSLLLVTITVSVAGLIGWAFAAELPALPWVLPALAALHPQLALIGVSVSSDNLAGLIGALVFWLLLLVARNGLSWRRGLLLLGLLALGFWTKRTTLFLLPTALCGVLPALYVNSVRRWRRSDGQARRRAALLAGGGGLGLIALLTLSPLGATLLRLCNSYFFDNAAQWRLFVFTEYLRALPFALGPWLRQNVLFMNRTFWADVGWHRGVLPDALALTLLALTLLAWLSSIVVAARSWRRMPGWQRQFIVVCWIGLILCLSQTLLSYLITPPAVALAQGRYLFPVFMPIMFLIAVGLSGWWRTRWRRTLTMALIVAAVGFDVYTIVGLLLPAFYS